MFVAEDVLRFLVPDSAVSFRRDTARRKRSWPTDKTALVPIVVLLAADGELDDDRIASSV